MSVHRPSRLPFARRLLDSYLNGPLVVSEHVTRERLSCSTSHPPAPLSLNENTSQGMPSQMRAKSLAAGIITGVAAASSGVGWWDPLGSPMHKGSSGFEAQASLSPRK